MMDAKVRAYLQAIGYRVEPYELRSGKAGESFYTYRLNGGPSLANPLLRSPDDAFAIALAHSRSPEGMVLTHSAKEAWLLDNGGGGLTLYRWPDGEGHNIATERLVRDKSPALGHMEETFAASVLGSPQDAVEALCQRVLEAQG